MGKKNRKISRFEIKSNVIVKDTSVTQLPKFAPLQLNTDIQILHPSKWLGSAAESNGLQNVLFSSPDGFYSFQMAYKFPEYIGNVDVISDAENIKQLLNLSFCKDSVSMIVHKIENTLLIDKFDIHKQLICPINNTHGWDWLKKFFYDNIAKSFDRKGKCYTHRPNTISRIQRKIYYTKFLFHCINNSSNSNNINELPKKVSSRSNTLSNTEGLTLPEPSSDEKYLENPKNLKIFNQNVLWKFGNNQMLLGTDVPVFEDETYSRLTLRLKDMSKHLNVSTIINYWLDNLMCDVPEVKICYHLNGIVKKFISLKTKDLPYLSESKFSPETIRNITHNILELLKQNTPKVGHTYWLFKGKNDDVIQLYDLTLLHSKSLKEGLYKDPNPFTTPVAMLFYHIAKHLKYNQIDKNPSKSGTIEILLKQCLIMLNKITYPHLFTSVYYMLSDLYLPCYLKPSCPDLENLIYYNSDINSLSSPSNEQFMFSINIECLSLPPITILKSKNSLKLTLEEHCQNALIYVKCGLDCLQFFSVLISSKDISYQKYLTTLLNQKACLAYGTLAEFHFRDSDKFPKALKYYYNAMECYPQNKKNVHSQELLTSLLLHCGDIYFFISYKDRYKQFAQKFEDELEKADDYGVIKALQSNWKQPSYKKNLFGDNTIQDLVQNQFESTVTVLKVALNCYNRSLKYGSIDVIGNKRIPVVCDRIITEYKNQIDELKIKNQLTESKIDFLIKELNYYFLLAVNSYKPTGNKLGLAQLYLNYGLIYYSIGIYVVFPMSNTVNSFENLNTIKMNYFDTAVNYLEKSLSVLGSRFAFPDKWDANFWELSSIIFNIAVLTERFFLNTTENDKYIISWYLKSMKYLDLENETEQKFNYHFRNGYIHNRLGTIYHKRLKLLYEFNSTLVKEDKLKFNTIHNQCVAHYEEAVKIYFKWNCPFDILLVISKQIDLIEHDTKESMPKVQNVLSTVQHLEKCMIPLQTMRDKRCLVNSQFYKNNDYKDEDYTEFHVKEQLLHLRNQGATVLRNAMQLVTLNTICRFSHKKYQLKKAYNEVLYMFNNNEKLNIVEIIEIVIKIITLISKLNL